MKYTRYDMKRKNSNNIVLGVVLFSTLIFAFIIGTVIFNIFLKDSAINEVATKPSSGVAEVVNKNPEKKVAKYIVIQNGLFAKPEYIEQAKNKLAPYGNHFTVQEEKGTRVLLGIFNVEESEKVIKNLIENSIENSKISFEINPENNPCDEEISAIITNELDILAKLSSKDVKSVKIEDFKKWTSDLKEVEKDSKNISLLNEIKAHVKGLPDEMTKEKVAECYSLIYNILKKINNK